MTHPYGLITLKDSETLEHTLTLACMAFPAGAINVCEIGVHKGRTAKGINQYITNIRGRQLVYTGVDNQKDLPITPPFKGCILLLGDSVKMAEFIAENSQHVVLIDGDHSYNGVIRDFEAYAPLLVRGGYMMFHDTSQNIPPFKDYQSGEKDDPHSYIAVRLAIERLGILESENWSVVFDEADSISDTGGFIVIKKLI